MQGRYRTLAELKQALDGGQEIDPLTLDNDDTHAYAGEECVFRMHPADVLAQALDLLGIPHAEA